ncbi:hypothetical protein GF343_00850 [Candidatus Woesearchaeota archaeon]|nr:hypothetical protein [Candidatus Woesearchaeota archaeon]
MAFFDKAMKYVGLKEKVSSKITRPGKIANLKEKIGQLQADILELERQIRELKSTKKEAEDIINTLTDQFDKEKSGANRAKIRATILQTAAKVKKLGHKIAAREKNMAAKTEQAAELEQELAREKKMVPAYA